MKWDTGILSPDPNWIVEDGTNRNPRWSCAENKLFENALAVYDKDTPDRWQKVAAMIPGKTVGDVMKQYKALEDDVTDIEAGLVSVPEYSTPFTVDYWVNSSSSSGYDPSRGFSGKRSSSSSGRPSEQERKKGVPWTEEEHKLFLLGLKKHGKGDWRNISRNFVLTRTPTQVASHAQKYFIRQLSGGKDKRRASIHDITTVNLTESSTPTRPTPPPPPPPPPSSSSQDMMISQQQANVNPAVPRSQFHQWNNQGLFMSPFGVNNGDDSSPSSSSCFEFKMQAQSLHRTGLHHHHHHHQSSYLLAPQAQNMVFQLP